MIRYFDGDGESSVGDVHECNLCTSIVVRNQLQLPRPLLRPQLHAVVLVAWVDAAGFAADIPVVADIVVADDRRYDCNMGPYRCQ